MIFLDLVGGGGSAKSCFVVTGLVRTIDLFRELSPGDAGRYEESEPLAEGVVELGLALSVSWKAVGGKLKAGAALALSLPRMSLEDPGVGGGFGLGMVVGFA